MSFLSLVAVKKPTDKHGLYPACGANGNFLAKESVTALVSLYVVTPECKITLVLLKKIESTEGTHELNPIPNEFICSDNFWSKVTFFFVGVMDKFLSSIRYTSIHAPCLCITK